ncbi:MAG TPA: hypothetical protein PL131_00800 [Methylotenera sp.]|nr:hypothetical protein [Methylotenera sp.]HPH04385.1 hypothetical protein [Methylotenera sp.]HPM99939.1 hypothetical protein [Methylotenera sp.]
MKKIYKIYIGFIIVVFTFFILVGFLDKFEYQNSVNGSVIRCYLAISKHTYGGNTICLATLDDGHIAEFSSLQQLQAGEKVTFVKYKRNWLGSIKYEKI